jgi:hypothetical protein
MRIETEEKKTKKQVVSSVYRGLGRLLVSMTLSPSQREAVSGFASKKNKAIQKFQVSNSSRSLLALGLLVTSIYTSTEDQQR